MSVIVRVQDIQSSLNQTVSGRIATQRSYNTRTFKTCRLQIVYIIIIHKAPLTTTFCECAPCCVILPLWRYLYNILYRNGLMVIICIICATGTTRICYIGAGVDGRGKENERQSRSRIFPCLKPFYLIVDISGDVTTMARTHITI